jgi:3-oxoadipate enol-lactonase
VPVLNADVPLIKEGTGPPLMLLHCLGVDHRFWDFARPLTQDFTLYRYDLPGHGVSPVPHGAYSIADLADQLAAIMEKHAITRAHIGGISLGGLIAQDFAARYPKRVDRLALIDTTPRYTDEMRRMWAERAGTARSKGVVVMVDALLRIWFSKQAIAQNDAGVSYVRETLTYCNGEAYAVACEALAAADLRAALGSIRAKTLVVCGDDDIPSFLDAARQLAGSIPDARLEWISGTRHASVLEKPADAVALLRSFLQMT